MDDSRMLPALRSIGVSPQVLRRLRKAARRRGQTFDDFFRWFVETADALAVVGPFRDAGPGCTEN